MIRAREAHCNSEQYTTRLQPHEQLLMGWIKGGMAMVMGRVMIWVGEW